MREMLKFYIDGQWVDPVTPNPFDVINPATEEVCGHISLGSGADVDKAVAAAVKAADSYAATSREERIQLLQAILPGSGWNKSGGSRGHIPAEPGAGRSRLARGRSQLRRSPYFGPSPRGCGRASGHVWSTVRCRPEASGS